MAIAGRANPWNNSYDSSVVQDDKMGMEIVAPPMLPKLVFAGGGLSLWTAQAPRLCFAVADTQRRGVVTHYDISEERA
jgi:hypothetical protein